MDRNHRWQTVFPFLLLGSTKKNYRHKNSVLQHGYISKLLTLKADSQYLLKTFRKNFRFEETLNKALKQYRQQNHEIAIPLYNHKTKSYKFFYFKKVILWFKKLLDTDICLIDIKGTLWSVWKWKEEQVSKPHNPLP